MDVFGSTYTPECSQLELSRAAAHRYELVTAVHDRPVVRRRSYRLDHRLRHALAGRLVATARLIDAT